MKKGDIITIRDQQTILQMMKGKSGDFTKGLDLQVTEVQTFGTNTIRWTLITTDTSYVVVIKEVSDAKDIRVMFVPEGFPAGDRKDWIDAGFHWLFMPPADENNFKPADLIYTEDVINGDIKFLQKCPTIHCVGMNTICAIHEWKTTQPCENPELIVFEVGGVDDPRGGFIKFYQGCNINPNDFEVLPC